MEELKCEVQEEVAKVGLTMNAKKTHIIKIEKWNAFGKYRKQRQTVSVDD